MAADTVPFIDPRRRAPSRHRRVLVRAPATLPSVGIVVGESAVLAVLFGLAPSSPVAVLPAFFLLFLLPAFASILLTAPFAEILGGRLTFRRSLLLTVTSGLFPLPIAAAWRVAYAIAPGSMPSVAAVLLFLQGPVLWFRHMTLFGVSNPSHVRTLPVSLSGPLIGVATVFVLFQPTAALLAQAALFLLIGFLASALVLRAADRPMRREFGTSGVSLIRPMLDHINNRDPLATEAIERFFAKFATHVDLVVRLVAFRSKGGIKATIALPTVHPGPFAALGSSDLPRRLSDRLGPKAGIVFVPHTPCSHDLDLPTTADFERVAAETSSLLDVVGEGSEDGPSSPLLGAGDGSLARAQILGDTALVFVTQAPSPTDDIDFSAVDPIARRLETPGGLRVAFIDAHNSYVEDEGDLTYGSPAAERLAVDAEAAIERARAAARPGPVRIGVAVRDNYPMAETGIGPHGIRALVVEAAGTKTAYVVVDGNNLVIGFRARILDTLRSLVDSAEILTTDNHIVHEVDGGTNPVGDRYPVEALSGDIHELVKAALQDLSEVRIASGVRRIRSVPVLRPGWTARLLTSLGDTVSMFASSFLMTFLLVLTGSLVFLLAFR